MIRPSAVRGKLHLRFVALADHRRDEVQDPPHGRPTGRLARVWNEAQRAGRIIRITAVKKAKPQILGRVG
jgi:hypothetical protein